jgi:hypothetical protein
MKTKFDIKIKKNQIRRGKIKKKNQLKKDKNKNKTNKY